MIFQQNVGVLIVLRLQYFSDSLFRSHSNPIYRKSMPFHSLKHLQKSHYPHFRNGSFLIILCVYNEAKNPVSLPCPCVYRIHFPLLNKAFISPSSARKKEVAPKFRLCQTPPTLPEGVCVLSRVFEIETFFNNARKNCDAHNVRNNTGIYYFLVGCKIVSAYANVKFYNQAIYFRLKMEKTERI